MEVMLGDAQHEWPIMVGIVPDLPVPLLVGPDWPDFS